MQFHTHFSFNHQYGKVEESIVLNTEEYSYHTKIGKDDFAYGTSLVLYSNTTVNEEISSKFMRQGSVVYADSAQGKGQDYWNKIRPKNLNTKEINFIKDQDSIRDYEHSSAYIEKLDSITNHNDIWSVLLSGVNFYNREKGTSYYFHSLLQTVRPFAVGGYRHAVAGNFSKTWTKENRLTLGYEVNYGFRNKNIKGALSIDYLYNPKKFGSFSIRGGDNFAILNEYESIQGTFSRGNYLQKYFYGIGAAYELANGLMIDANLDYATFRSIENIELAPWSETIFGAFNVPKEFNGYNQLVLDVELTLIPYQKYQLTQYKKELLGSDWPTFNIRYKKGIKPFGESNVNYDFVQLNVNKVVSLNSFGDSKFEINTGQFFNDREIRIADQKFFRGSDRYFYSDPLRSFQFLSPTFVTTNPFFQGHYLHQFNGALLNKVPFIKRFRLQTLAGTSILLLADDNFRHTEAYVGLAKPFRIKKQLFKLNTVYVVSSNSDTGYREGFKVGIAFFDSFTKSWNY
jgi:hypothetical protein